MDVLSEVLRVVRLSGVVHFSAEFTQPWAFTTSPPEMLAARLKVPEGSVTPFHVCVEGRCWVTSGKLPPIAIEADDVIVIPRGDQHVMASDPGVAPVPIQDIYSQPSRDQITCLRYGGGGTSARFICGYLQADHQFDPLLKSLPAVLCVRSRHGTLTLETLDATGRRVQPIEHEREAEWWLASVRYLISETAVPGPGNRAVLARLAELLFLELLRWELRYAAQDRSGWLAGLHDPHVGRVLRLLHALPDRPWTVDELAAEAAISRAALAKRFVELVGQSPIQYLAGWRMHLARHLLQESNTRRRRDRGEGRIRIGGGVQSRLPPARRLATRAVAAGDDSSTTRPRAIRRVLGPAGVTPDRRPRRSCGWPGEVIPYRDDVMRANDYSLTPSAKYPGCSELRTVEATSPIPSPCGTGGGRDGQTNFSDRGGNPARRRHARWPACAILLVTADPPDCSICTGRRAGSLRPADRGPHG